MYFLNLLKWFVSLVSAPLMEEQTMSEDASCSSSFSDEQLLGLRKKAAKHSEEERKYAV